MELRRYYLVFRNHMLLIVAAVIVALAVGWTTAPRTKVYSAQASLYVGPSNLPAASNNSPSGPLATAQQIIYTYTRMIVSRPVMELAAQMAGNIRPPFVAEVETTASQVQFTQLIIVRVVDKDPEVAAALANATVSAFQSKTAAINSGSGGVPSFPVFPFESAVPSSQPLKNDVRSRLITSGLFGLIIGAAAAFVLEHLDVTVRGAGDATRRLELPVLGTIPLQRQRA